MNIDPKYLGIPNICFSLTEKDDDREEKYAKQRMEQGFDESETWCLASTMARFILPRLKSFQKWANIDWDGEHDKPLGEAIPKMIRAFELVLKDDASWIWNEDEQKEYEEGMDLFVEYYLGLWW